MADNNTSETMMNEQVVDSAQADPTTATETKAEAASDAKKEPLSPEMKAIAAEMAAIEERLAKQQAAARKKLAALRAVLPELRKEHHIPPLLREEADHFPVILSLLCGKKQHSSVSALR